ncbi:MAG: endonuclease III [Magnetococcales bacterium]|nr:endonuclease III [Magnetococcales bacterium]
MKKSDVMAVFSAFQLDNPEPRGELSFRNPFELLVAVVLSAQATDKVVNQVTPTLFAVAPDPRAMVELGEEGISRHIRRIGLYHTKARNIDHLCHDLLTKFDGQVPDRREALESLPGVGRKTANVVLNIIFRQPTVAVDTHVFRVANRTGLASGKTPAQVEKILLVTIPPQFLLHAHHWLILHGRHVCQARRPRCAACLIRRWCAIGKNLPETPSP